MVAQPKWTYEGEPLELDLDPKPTNIVCLATHAGSHVPEKYRCRLTEEMLSFNKRVLLNFSDHSCGSLIPDDLPADRVVVSEYSRILGDPNRHTDSEDLFPVEDFNGVAVWSTPLTPEDKEDLLANHYRKYHQKVEAVISEAESKNDRVIVFDIHDTGNLMLGISPELDTLRGEHIPEISLGDKDGESCDPEIMHAFALAVEKHLGFKPMINYPYKGGFVTTKYGKDYNDALPESERFKRNVIQIELGRYLYMDEKTQEINQEQLAIIKAGLSAAMNEVGVMFS